MFERKRTIFVLPQCPDNSLITICVTFQNSLLGHRIVWLLQEWFQSWKQVCSSGWTQHCALCCRARNSKVQRYFTGHVTLATSPHLIIEIRCVFWKRQLPLIQQDCFHYKQVSWSQSSMEPAVTRPCSSTAAATVHPKPQWSQCDHSLRWCGSMEGWEHNSGDQVREVRAGVEEVSGVGRGVERRQLFRKSWNTEECK